MRPHIVTQLKSHAATVGRHAKDHFIPHEGNGHHPHVLKHRVLLGYSILLVLLKAVALAGAVALPSSSLFASAITAQNIISLTNATREGLGLPALTVDGRLTNAAEAKARDMVVNQYFAHTSPAGISPWYWIKKFGYIYRYSGENLAVHYVEAEDVQGGWLASPTHRANIVNPRFVNIGVGVASGDFEGYPSIFVVQMFGQPKDAETQTAVAASTSTPTVPAPEPTEAKPAVLAAERAAPIDEARVKVKQHPKTYTVTLAVASATHVTVQLAAASAPMMQQPGTDVWVGSVPYDKNAFAANGEPLYAIVQGEDGTNTTQALAWVAPGSRTDQVFVWNADTQREVKLMGIFTLDGLNDAVRRAYVFFIIFLVAALLINIFVKFHVQKLSVIAHAVAVIGVGLFLLIL